MFDTHLKNKKLSCWVKIIFTSLCLYMSKHRRACVHLCENVCIYYLEAQTQMVRCPAVFQEMKCNLMLNMEGVLSPHSYNVIAVCHSKFVRNVSPPLQGIRGGNACTDLNIIDIKRSVFQEILSLDPNDSHVFQLTYGYSLINVRKITKQLYFLLFPLVKNLSHFNYLKRSNVAQSSLSLFISIYVWQVSLALCTVVACSQGGFLEWNRTINFLTPKWKCRKGNITQTWCRLQWATIYSTCS